jgi:hypothetical protein
MRCKGEALSGQAWLLARSGPLAPAHLDRSVWSAGACHVCQCIYTGKRLCLNASTRVSELEGWSVDYTTPAAMKRPRRLSPASANRHLGTLLVMARQQANHTQDTAHKAAGWSKRKLQMLETAETVVSDPDLHVLLALYDIAEDERPAWHELAGDARKKGWWDTYDKSDLPPTAKRFIGLEAGAVRIRQFEPLIIHGLLETPAYRQVIMTSTTATNRPPEQIAALIEVSQRRQEILFDPTPLELWAVLDEAALHRSVGSPEVRREQLRHLADVAEAQDNIRVQVIPYDAGPHAGLHGSFLIMDFGWPNDPGLVFLESSPDRAAYLDRRGDVYSYSQVFEQLIRVAMAPADSVQMLRDLAR